MTDVIRFNPPSKFDTNEVLAEFGDIFSTGVYTNNGPKVKALEKKLAEYSSSYVNVVSNGTLAIQLSIRALDLSGEIITTPFTFVSTVSSILWGNCKPVFADIDPETLCIDPAQIRSKITKHTKAILGVHIFGNICDVDAIDAIAREYGLKVIYDGAHSFGIRHKKLPIERWGDCSALSLHAFKILSTVEGGAVFSNDPEVHENIFRIRYFGKNIDNLDIQLGINAKMSEFHAALGLVSFRHAHDEIARRAHIAATYRSRLKDIDGIILQKIDPHISSNYSFFPIILRDKTALDQLLLNGKKNGVEFRKYFHPSLNLLPYLEKRDDCPHAESLADRVLCLPIGSHLSDSDISRVIDLVLSSL